LTSRPGGAGCAMAGMGFIAVVCAALLAAMLSSLRIPKDAPRPRMYRTEADLAALVKALEVYREAYGAYPPRGAAGLRLATDHLSRNADYLPDGPPPDAWGRPYCYVPHTEYAEPGSGALRMDEEFAAPDTYQVYSAGADGDPGLESAEARRDNICNWDPDKSWRAVYGKPSR